MSQAGGKRPTERDVHSLRMPDVLPPGDRGTDGISRQTAKVARYRVHEPLGRQRNFLMDFVDVEVTYVLGKLEAARQPYFIIVEENQVVAFWMS